MRYLISFSILLNIYYLATWTYVFNKYDAQIERVEKFNTFYLGIPLWILSIIIIALTIISIITLFRYKINNKSANISSNLTLTIIVFQILFGGLFIFQFL